MIFSGKDISPISNESPSLLEAAKERESLDDDDDDGEDEVDEDEEADEDEGSVT